MRSYLIIAAILIITGCTAAPAFKQVSKGIFPEKEYARITPQAGGKDVGLLSSIGENLILITGVDGKNTETLGCAPSFPQEAYLLPGQHELNIRFVRSPLFADICISLNAQANKIYLLNYKTYQYSVQVWLTDSVTGNLAGSICGFEGYPKKIHNNSSKQDAQTASLLEAFSPHSPDAQGRVVVHTV